nr:hypothetical protein [uncultured Prevotella sp.]
MHRGLCYRLCPIIYKVVSFYLLFGTTLGKVVPFYLLFGTTLAKVVPFYLLFGTTLGEGSAILSIV